MLEAAFLAGFDTRSGWKLIGQWPEAIDLSGLEVTVLPSGSHSTAQDVIFFTRKFLTNGQETTLAGVAAFVNTEDVFSDRGARLNSLGVLLSKGCEDPWEYIESLRAKVQDLSTLEGKALVQSLENLVNDGTLREAHDSGRGQITGDDDDERGNLRARLRNPLHPLHTFFRLPYTLGPRMWTLWRAVLLDQKILIVTEAPVLGAGLDAWNIAHLVSKRGQTARSLPLGAVSLQDVARLKAMRHGWIAFTTDKILLESQDLYDLVWNQSDHAAISKHRIMVNKRAPAFLKGSRSVDRSDHLFVAAKANGSDRAFTKHLLKMSEPLIAANYDPSLAAHGWRASLSSFCTTALNLLLGGWWGWWLWQKPTTPMASSGPITLENHDPAWTSLPEDEVRSDDHRAEEDRSLLEDDRGSDMTELAENAMHREIEMNLLHFVDLRSERLLLGLESLVKTNGSHIIITSSLLEDLGLSANRSDAEFVLALLEQRFNQVPSKLTIQLDWIDVVLDWCSRYI